MRQRAALRAFEKVNCAFRLSSNSNVRKISLSCNNRYERSPDVQSRLEWSYSHGYGAVPLCGGTVGETFLKTVEANPDRECVVFCEDGVRRSFQELLVEVDKMAAGLHNLGFRKGDRVGIWGPSTLEWVVTQFATARIGAILVNVNPAYQTKEAEFALRKTQVKGIVTASNFKTQNYYEMLKHIAPELATSAPGELKSKHLPDLTTVIMMGTDNKPGTLSYGNILDVGSSKDIADIQNISRSLDTDDCINIQFTSGTTGNPKGATLTHHNIINNIRFIGKRLGFDVYHHRSACQVPLYHCFGMVGGSLAMSVFGNCIIFPCAGYDPGLTLKALEEEKVDILYGTPTMFIDMMAHPDRTKYNYEKLSKGIMAGSHCPPEVVQKFESLFQCKITVGYGTTENSPVTFMTYFDDDEGARTTTVGRAFPFTEAKIVGEKGETLPVNTPGEIWIRGYCVMRGYWEDEEKTADTITPEGWYKTGDTGTIDEGGFCQIVGRTKDMIIRGGENIYPAEIESFLHTFEKIDNVQIFGVPDSRLGEEVAAWISLKEGTTSSPEEIRDFCKGKISHFKIPRHIKFVTEFPITVTRKIQKFKMRDEYSRELGLEE